MSVIGRLDGQVNDLLIAPLEQRNSKIDYEPLEHPAPDESDENTRREVERKERREALPIWLL